MGRLAAYVASEVGCRNHPRPRSLRQRATVMASAIRLPSYKSHSPPSRQGAYQRAGHKPGPRSVLRVLKVVSPARALVREIEAHYGKFILDFSDAISRRVLLDTARPRQPAGQPAATGDLCHEAPTPAVTAQAARQLPDQSTTLRVDSSSTDDSRLRGALPLADISRASFGQVSPPSRSVTG
jgi:hypothetical protein